MSFNNFSVGRDISIDILTQTGLQRFTLVTGFSKRQETSSIQIMGLDGICRPIELPRYWAGSLDLERADSSVDDYFAGLESSYYQGLNVLGATITETIQEPGGNTTQYRYENVVFKLEDAGDWRGDANVKMRIGFVAARRKKVQ